LKTKNHKHRYINVSNTLMGASISRKNDLLDTPLLFIIKKDKHVQHVIMFFIMKFKNDLQGEREGRDI